MDDLSGRGGAPCGRASLLLRLGRLLDGRGADLLPVVRAPSRISTVRHIILVLLLLIFFSVALECAISHPAVAGFRKETYRPTGWNGIPRMGDQGVEISAHGSLRAYTWATVSTRGNQSQKTPGDSSRPRRSG